MRRLTLKLLCAFNFFQKWKQLIIVISEKRILQFSTRTLLKLLYPDFFKLVSPQ